MKKVECDICGKIYTNERRCMVTLTEHRKIEDNFMSTRGVEKTKRTFDLCGDCYGKQWDLIMTAWGNNKKRRNK